MKLKSDCREAKAKELQQTADVNDMNDMKRFYTGLRDVYGPRFLDGHSGMESTWSFLRHNVSEWLMASSQDVRHNRKAINGIKYFNTGMQAYVAHGSVQCKEFQIPVYLKYRYYRQLVKNIFISCAMCTENSE
ncbi:hypothetical protein CHS0354_027987 [Potamilus streckersoni]|uniref:Uncharacterized protein n=1 Tax=Potamilus streckersoni TaxID=2493646 RepID=A0AAE0T5H1_9BIVA|nr:hypothetical protein CHS0354_027987 [Potamilus streckersoni]